MHHDLQKLLGVQYFGPKVDGNDDFFSDRSEEIPSYRFPESYTALLPTAIPFISLQICTPQVEVCWCNRETLLLKVCRRLPQGTYRGLPYDKWVHQGKACSVNPLRPELAMFNIEGRGSIESLVVKCESCGVTKGLASAFAQRR